MTCPTSSTAVPVAFATPMIREATSRTWPTEPGAPVSSAACSVCTESMTQTSGRSASIVARTVARSVSASTGTCSAASPSRSARSRICAGDSSPDTYSVDRPAPARCPSAIPVSVDLPIPGEPPSSTSDPGTSPPPSTRSNSPMPVGSRGRRSARTSASLTGRAAVPALRFAAAAATGRDSSTSVFHAPQPGHCPMPARLGVPAVAADVLGVRSRHR